MWEFLCQTEKFKSSSIPNTTKEWIELSSNRKEEEEFYTFEKEIIQN